jgi:hypothetical protein
LHPPSGARKLTPVPKKASYWIMGAIVSTIFLVAGVLLLIGIPGHTEPGFVNPDNKWDHVPLRIGCASYAPVEVDDWRDHPCEQVQAVVNRVNERVTDRDHLPNGIFIYSGHGADPDDQDILVVVGTPHDASSHWAESNGYAELVGQGTTYNMCLAQTSNTGTNEMLFQVLHHELACHCLGLAHDDHQASICRDPDLYPLEPIPDGQFPLRLTDFDVELLRGKYGPQG